MTAEIVDIGFAEKSESWCLSSRFFPSKIGGKPAWLDLKHLPTAEQLACEYCHDPCVFLCQVYAPYEDDDKAFHRTLFVFVCKNPDCCKDNQSGNVKVLRSQLQRENEFYDPEPPIENEHWRTDISVDKWTKTCQVCGIFSANRCAKCKNVNYCGKSHQVWDWKNGHKSSCGEEQPGDNSAKFLFPEYELVIEREDYVDCCDKNDNTEDEINKYEELVKTGKAGTLQSEKDIDDDLLKMASNIEDKTFSKFKTRVKSDPDQVIRYNKGGKPLYISSANQPQDIPKCECGSERQFEFQIMPQLLVYLELDSVLKSIDWGVILVYSCKNSCGTKPGYVQEYTWKQDIVKESSESGTNDDD